MTIVQTKLTRSNASANRQRGVAAIEFALVFFLLLGVVYSVATLGAVLYIQQVVSRAAEDGARAIPLLPKSTTFGTTEQNRIKGVVYDSLAAALVVPNTAASDPRKWVAERVDVKVLTPSVVGASPYKTSVVTVSYPYSANRLLPSILLFDISRWMPDMLTGRATVVL